VRLIPPLAPQPFLKKKPREILPGKSSCSFFIGCVSNYVFPEIAEAVLAIFRHLDISAFIPPDQGCCGLMAFGTGAADIDRKVAKKNIEAFESTGATPIVAFCSSCSSHLKEYGTLFEDEPWRSRALRFSQRVKDLSEYLVSAGFETTAIGKALHPASRLTFHDPCHLRRKQGVFEQPRQLLKCVDGIEFIETGGEQLCCGSGGSFNLSHYAASQNIFKRRLKRVEDAAVDTVVTTCMGCLLQFLDGIHQEGKSMRCKHLAEVLSESFSCEKSLTQIVQ
jgi:glycolate oxidase iron-sulfur subunit